MNISEEEIIAGVLPEKARGSLVQYLLQQKGAGNDIVPLSVCVRKDLK